MTVHTYPKMIVTFCTHYMIHWDIGFKNSSLETEQQGERKESGLDLEF